MKGLIYNYKLDYGGVSNFSLNFKEAAQNNIKVDIATSFNNRNEKDVIVLNNKNMYFELIKLLISKEYDFFLCEASITIFFLKLLSILKRKKIVFITVVHTRLDLLFKKRGFRGFLFKILVFMSMNFSDKIVCVSDGLLEDLKKKKFIANKKLVRIYNPIIQKIKNEGRVNIDIEKKFKINLGIVGWIYDIKRQKDVVIALDKLKNKKYNLKIIGGISDKSYYKKLENVIEKLNLTDQVEFLGILEDKKEIYRDLDILILSSESEALPTVIAEAMGYGIPVISSDCDFGPNEILCNNKFGMLYEVGNIEQLANAINIMCNNKIYNHYRKISNDRVIDFTFDKCINEYLKVIKGNL